MHKKLITAAAATLLAFGAQAANPVATIDRSFTEYAGAGPIGNNNINNNTNLYWMFESTGTWLGQAVNSWFLVWDPLNSRVASGTIKFDQTILFVHDEKAELIATSAFGKPGVTYNYTHSLVGLEGADRSATSFAGDTLTFRWTASNPGDHIRVMTAVPEPESYALLLAGLGAVGFMARRTRKN
jgi:hypothetical protein